MGKHKKIKIGKPQEINNQPKSLIEPIKEPRLPADFGNGLFCCVFLERYMHFKHHKFGFSKKHPKVKDFITAVYEPIYKTYSKLTWSQVDARPHCGFIKNLNKVQNEVLKDYTNEVKENLYHIDLTNSHRLIGYRNKGVFYPILDDTNHEFTNL